MIDPHKLRRSNLLPSILSSILLVKISHLLYANRIYNQPSGYPDDRSSP
jgi:hypothetical protein